MQTKRDFARPGTPFRKPVMLARLISVGVFISFFTIMLFAAPSLAQNLTPELQKTFLK